MKNRYPGIHSFTADDSPIFYGRTREIKELFRLVVLNNVVVLFGKSGTGKTSLLQAGVAPLLHERYLQPLKIRLNNIQQPIERQIYEQFEEAHYLPMDTPDTLSLWEYCKQFDYSEDSEAFTPLLILDQFEELFTLYADKPEVQLNFVRQLADVVNGNIPEGLESRLREVNSTLSEAEMLRRLSPPKVNIIISIRSDFLYLLDRISAYIPAILRCRYELSALDDENARLAMTEPAAQEGEFASPTFEYTEAAIQNILSTLTAKLRTENQVVGTETGKREIEAFQLQLLCSRIEKKLLDDLKSPFPPAKPIRIAPEFYGGTEGIKNMLSDFYNAVLSKIQENRRLRVQKLIEEKLIVNERRIIQEKEFIKKEYILTDEDLLLLCNERLLREEPRGGAFYYEVSHDMLVGPILESYRKRAELEEKNRAITEKAELEAKAASEQAEKEKAQKQLRTVRLLLGVAVIALSFAFYQAVSANIIKQNAVKSDSTAQREARKAKEEKQIAKNATELADSLRIKSDSVAKKAAKSDTLATRKAEEAKREREKAVAEQEKTKKTLDKLKLSQTLAAAQKILTFAENYENLGEKKYAIQNYETILDSLKEYPQNPLYHNAKHKIEKLSWEK